MLHENKDCVWQSAAVHWFDCRCYYLKELSGLEDDLSLSVLMGFNGGKDKRINCGLYSYCNYVA